MAVVSGKSIRLYGVLALIGALFLSGMFLNHLAPVRAQGDLDAARKTAQSWLLKQLNKPALILVSYTYSGSTWPDSSLGCAAPGQSITPGSVSGYVWTFAFDNQVSYEVHSGLNGTPAVLCGATNLAKEVKLVSYSGTDFSILVPEYWLVFPTGSEVLFGPGPLAACDQPGMRVSSLGRVSNDTTPDTLLDQYVKAAGVQDTPAGRLAVGTGGRSTTFETSCETQKRTWRITTFVQYGSASRIEQWVPSADLEVWNPLFDQMLGQFGPPSSNPTVSTAAPGAGSTAAENTPQPSATPALNPLPLAHLFVGDLFVGSLNNLPGRSATTTPMFERYYLGFSPDGLVVSYIDTTNGELRVMNVSEGLSPRKLAGNVDPRFPPAWSPDSQQVAYTTAAGQKDSNGADLLDIDTIPAAGGTPQRVTTFAFGGTCPAESSDPADAAYAHETGPGDQENVLVWMANEQFLVSTRCDGGLGLLNPANGQVTEFGTDLHGGVLSPDRSRFAARTDSGIALLDFTQWQRTNLRVGQGARQLAWGPDGQTLYYSTETPSQNVTLDDSSLAQRGQDVFGTWPVTLSDYTLTIVQLDVPTVKESVIWQGTGRAVGRIAPAPDGSGILFSLIPASLPLGDVFRGNGDTMAIRAKWPDPVLYWLAAGTSTPSLLIYSGEPAFAPFGPPSK